MRDRRRSLRGPSDDIWMQGFGSSPENLLRRGLVAGAEAPRNSVRCPWGRRIPATSRPATSAMPRQPAEPSLSWQRSVSSTFEYSSATPHRRHSWNDEIDGAGTEDDRGISTVTVQWVLRSSCILRWDSHIHHVGKFANFLRVPIFWSISWRVTLRLLDCATAVSVQNLMFCFYVIILTSAKPVVRACCLACACYRYKTLTKIVNYVNK